MQPGPKGPGCRRTGRPVLPPVGRRRTGRRAGPVGVLVHVGLTRQAGDLVHEGVGETPERLRVGVAATGGGAPDPESLRGLPDALMPQIASLSGQAYVDEYANRARSSSGAPAPDRGENGAPGTAAARALRARLHRTRSVTHRKQRIHNDGLA